MAKRIIRSQPKGAQGAAGMLPGTGALRPNTHRRSVRKRNTRVREHTLPAFGPTAHSPLLQSSGPKTRPQSMMGPPETPQAPDEGGLARVGELGTFPGLTQGQGSRPHPTHGRGGA